MEPTIYKPSNQPQKSQLKTFRFATKAFASPSESCNGSSTLEGQKHQRTVTSGLDSAKLRLRSNHGALGCRVAEHRRSGRHAVAPSLAEAPRITPWHGGGHVNTLRCAHSEVSCSCSTSGGAGAGCDKCPKLAQNTRAGYSKITKAHRIGPMPNWKGRSVP